MKAAMILCLGAMLCAAGAVQAASVVSEHIDGVVGGQFTTDSAGDFGPPGADLTGKTVTVQFDYVPADYKLHSPCAHTYPCKTYEALGASTVASAATISVTINGRTVTFVPSYSSLIKLFTNSSDLFQINTDAGVVSAKDAGIQVSLTLRSQPSFGAWLSPSNPPRGGNQGDLFEIFPPGSQVANEVVSFSVISSAQ